jgi:hypothetical protein
LVFVLILLGAAISWTAGSVRWLRGIETWQIHGTILCIYYVGPQAGGWLLEAQSISETVVVESMRRRLKKLHVLSSFHMC